MHISHNKYSDQRIPHDLYLANFTDLWLQFKCVTVSFANDFCITHGVAVQIRSAAAKNKQPQKQHVRTANSCLSRGELEKKPRKPDLHTAVAVTRAAAQDTSRLAV
jgi:hypothetical protein